MIEIIPTVVPSSFEDVDALLERCRGFAQTFHIDAADGIFAPNLTWTPTAGQTLPERESFAYEAHLMVARPQAAGSAFIASGAKRIIAHIAAFESADEAKQVFDMWKTAGAKETGVALLVDTPLEALDEYVLLCDCVTLMSIARIGTQGIPFDERAYGRVADVHARYPDLLIEVDGGVGEVQIAALARAGAKRFSVGGALAKSADPAATYQKLKSLAESAIQ